MILFPPLILTILNNLLFPERIGLFSNCLFALTFSLSRSVLAILKQPVNSYSSFKGNFKYYLLLELFCDVYVWTYNSNLKFHGNLCVLLSYTMHKAFITVCLSRYHIWFTKSFELLIKMRIFSLKNAQRKRHDQFYIEFHQFHEFSKTLMYPA